MNPDLFDHSWGSSSEKKDSVNQEISPAAILSMPFMHNL